MHLRILLWRLRQKDALPLASAPAFAQSLALEDVVSFSTDTPLSGTLGAPSYTSYMERPRTYAIQSSWRF